MASRRCGGWCRCRSLSTIALWQAARQPASWWRSSPTSSEYPDAFNAQKAGGPQPPSADLDRIITRVPAEMSGCGPAEHRAINDLGWGGEPFSRQVKSTSRVNSADRPKAALQTSCDPQHVPIATNMRRSKKSLFNHLIGGGQQLVAQ